MLNSMKTTPVSFGSYTGKWRFAYDETQIIITI